MVVEKKLWDPEENRRHYMTVKGYNDDKKRLSEPRIKLVAAAAEVLHAKRVLDVGCSDGFFSQLIPPDAEYDGVELNPEAIMNAYPRAKDRIVQADATTHSYKQSHYDFVFVGEILEHVPNPVEFLHHLKKSITAGGILVATSAAGRTMHEHPGNDEHLREWNLGEFIQVFQDAGYEVVDSNLAEVYPGRYTNLVAARPLKVGERNDERIMDAQ